MSDDDHQTRASSVGFRKFGKRRIQTRKREVEASNEKRSEAADRDSDATSESEDVEESAVVVKKSEKTSVVKSKRMKRNPMLSSSTRNRAIQKEQESTSSSESESSGGEEEERKKAMDIDCTYSSTNDAQAAGPKDLGATARSEIDTEIAKDYQTQFERVQQKLKAQEPGTSGEKVYRGLKMYGAREAKDSTKGKASSGLNHYGPIRAQQFMRATVRWDYAPDICKDYKETGFCTFGDSCKFLHDRSDYKHGWEVERDWQIEQEAKKAGKEEDYTIYSDED